MPEFRLGVGGIQTFSVLLVRALRELNPTAELSVFSKNDRTAVKPTEDSADEFTCFGDWRLPQRTPVWIGSLLRAAWRRRPDLVIATHANFTPMAKLLQKVANIPYLAVGHGIEVWELQNRSAGPGLRAADRLLAVSEFTRQQMASVLNLSPDDVGLLPNTFDEKLFAPGPKPEFLLQRYGLRPEQPVILSIGRLASAERYKGYDQILQALPKIREQLPEVHYVIGGKGPDRTRLETLIAELGVRDAVTLAGYIPEEELAAHYNLCDVFAMPSKGEGFGIVFLEAMACGKPVIAGNKDGSVDALRGGELGVLIDPDDQSELTGSLISVLKGTHQHPLIYQPDVLRQKVVEYFGSEAFRTTLAAHLDALLQRRGKKLERLV